MEQTMDEWRRDPTGRHPYRYVHGGHWSQHVSDGETSAVDPIGPQELETLPAPHEAEPEPPDPERPTTPPGAQVPAPPTEGEPAEAPTGAATTSQTNSETTSETAAGAAAEGAAWVSNQPRIENPPKRYNAFLSYSHSADGEFAPALQTGLQRLAKSWRQRRALEVFRDETGLSVNPGLWTSICQAMDGSDWFLLLSSPEAARSEWVGREIERWIELRGVDRILPVVTDGTWTWDEAAGDFAWDRPEAVTAVHPALRGVFNEEPRHVDMGWAKGDTQLTLRNAAFRDQVAELAAPLHGKTKDEIEGDDVREQRRTRRLARGGATSLAILTVFAVAAAGLAAINAREAVRQREEAVEQARLATGQRLADLSRTADGALRPLLAVQANRMSSSSQATGAMVDALTTGDSAGLAARLAGHGGDVQSVAYSPDGAHVVTTDALGAARVFTAEGEQVSTVDGLGAVDADFVTDDLVAVATPRGVALVPTDGEQPDEVVDVGGDVTHVARAGDHRSGVAGTALGTVARVAEDGEVLAQDDSAQSQPIRFVGASEDGETIVSGASGSDHRFRAGPPDGMTVVVHDPSDMSERSTWTADGAALAVSPDGSEVAVAPDGPEVTDDGTSSLVQVVDTEDGAEVGAVSTFGFYVTRAAQFGPDGTIAVTTTGGNDGAPGLAYLGTVDAPAAELASLRVDMSATYDIAISPDGGAVAVAGTDRATPLVPVGGGDFGAEIELDRGVASVPLSVSDENELAVVVPDTEPGSDAAEVGIGSLETGEVRILAESAGDRAVLSPDGTRLLTREGVLDTEDGELVGSADLPTPLLGLPPSFSADSSRVAYVVDSSPDRIWEVAVVDVAEGELVSVATSADPMCESGRTGSAAGAGTGRPYAACDPATSFLDLSPDGSLLALRPGGDSDPNSPSWIQVMDTADGSALATDETDGDGPATFSEDGDELLVQAGETVTSYEPTTLEPEGTGRSTDLVGRWEQDSDALAVVAACAVTIADPVALRPVAALPLETLEIEGGCERRPDAAWVGGGSALVTALDCSSLEEECPLQRWDLDPDRLAESLCGRSGRNLTLDEWEQFLPGWDYEVTCEQWPEAAEPAEPEDEASEDGDSEESEDGDSEGSGGDSDEEGAAEEGLTVDDLLAVEVPSSLGCADGSETVQLEDGYAECEVTEPFPATHSIWIDGLAPGDDGDPQGAVVGDLTGDGVDDGVILTYAAQGQAGNPVPRIWVYDSEGELLAEVLNMPARPSSITITDGELEIGGADFAETDNNADGPSIPVTVRLAYEDGEMVVVG